jgi:Ca2+-transporting ATPase
VTICSNTPYTTFIYDKLHIYLTLTIAKMAAPESEEAKTMENQGQDRAALNTALLDTSDALTPDPGTEDMFKTDQIKFAFSPGQLSKLLNPKSLNAFYALGGLNGIKRGLRTD